MNKIVALVLAAAAFFFFLYVLPLDSMPDIAREISNPYAASVVEQQGRNRSLLSEENRQLYDVVKSGLLSMQEEIVVRRFAYTEDDVKAVFWSIASDSPELFWVDWSCEVSSREDGIYILPQYLIEKSELAARRAELDAAVDALLAKATQANPATDYDKVLALHDALALQCSYLDSGDLLAHTSYGALVQGKAVCDGYAHAMDLALNRLGIESHYVEGSATQNGVSIGHAWNIAKLDGVYGHIDVTWDDFEPQRSAGPDVNIPLHVYFMLSDDEIALDHTVANGVPLPACGGDSYYKHTGTVGNLFEDISSGIEALLLQNIAKQSYFVEFQITNTEDYETVCESYDTIGAIIDSANETMDKQGWGVQLATRYSTARNETHHTLLVQFSLDQDD